MTSLRYGRERLWFRARQLLRLNTMLEDGSVKVDVISPAEERSGREGIVLPGQLEKVTRPGFGTNPRHEIETFLGARRPIEGTTRYEVRNALLYRSDIYQRGQKKFFNVRGTIHNINRNVEHHTSVIVRSSMVGCHFFGHWLRDDCTTTLIEEGEGTELFMPSPSWTDKEYYRQLLDLRQRELYACTADRLIFYHDIGQNADKIRRIQLHRARVRGNFAAENGSHIVYIKRGATAANRRLINEDEVVEQLAQRGVMVVEAETDSLDNVLRALACARLVISVEGSQISHNVYTLREGGGILAIQPPNRFFNSHLDWSRPLGIHYGVLVGDAAEGGFNVNVDDLLRTIDLFPA